MSDAPATSRTSPPTACRTTRRSRVYWDPEALARRSPARLRDLPRLPPVLQVLRLVSRRCSTLIDEQHDGDVRRGHRRRDASASWTPASSASSARCSARTRRATSTSSSSTSRSSSTATGPAARREGSRCATACSATRTAPGAGAGQPRDRQRHEPVAPSASSWRRRWASTATSCCPTSPRRPSRPGPQRAGADRGRARRRGGAVPDLLRAAQRAADRPGHGRGAGEERGRRPLRCRAACCGMPAWEKGDLESLQPQARANLAVLLPFVERGRQGAGHQSDLLDDAAPRVPDAGRAPGREPRRRGLAAAVMDPSEFLWSIRNEPRFSTAFKSTRRPGRRLPRAVPPARAGRRLQGARPARARCRASSRAPCSSAAATTAPTP